MNDLEKIQYVNILLLNEVDRICQKAGISYFLYAGTLLGAVREKNFIPWDDDADVGFLREDYERFLRVAKEELAPEFELVLPKDTGGFYDMIGKVTYRKSRLHKKCQEDEYYLDTCCRISVDLYIVDRAPKNSLLFGIQCFVLKTLYGMMMEKRYEIDYSGYSPLEWLQVRVLTIMGKPFKISFLMEQYDRVCRWFAHKDVPYVFTSNSVLQKLHVRFERGWFEDSEGTVGYLGEYAYRIPKGYEQILTARYGDYRKPRKEQFTVAHAAKNEVEVYVNGEMLL